MPEPWQHDQQSQEPRQNRQKQKHHDDNGPGQHRHQVVAHVSRAGQDRRHGVHLTRKQQRQAQYAKRIEDHGKHRPHEGAKAQHHQPVNAQKYAKGGHDIGHRAQAQKQGKNHVSQEKPKEQRHNDHHREPRQLTQTLRPKAGRNRAQPDAFARSNPPRHLIGAKRAERSHKGKAENRQDQPERMARPDRYAHQQPSRQHSGQPGQQPKGRGGAKIGPARAQGAANKPPCGCRNMRYARRQ
mmetsp:Transcript_27376/g.50294  ORF Transcript_27376/g.50294 Transcript_27376/m.50294 type:complete len:241 (+) Transcript_27376:589-1311(+)